jgi:hypothetical protein
MAAMKLQDERDNLIQNLIWAILTALGAAALPLLKVHWRGWTEPALYAFFGATWVAVVYTTLTGKRPFSGPGTTPQNLERRVKSWLDHYGFGMKSVPDEAAYFNIQVTLPSDHHVTVSRRKTSELYLTFVCLLTIEEDLQKDLAAMSPLARSRTLHEITLELSRVKISFSLNPRPSFLITLARQVLITPSLSSDQFLEFVNDMDFAVSQVMSAMVLAIGRNTASPAAAALPVATVANTAS